MKYEWVVCVLKSKSVHRSGRTGSGMRSIVLESRTNVYTLHVFCKSLNTADSRKFGYIGTNLLEDQNLVGCLQVLQLVGHQDTRLVLQQATDTPDTWDT